MKEQVLFVNNHNLRLTGIISRPKLQGRIPLVVMCHGFASGKNSKTNRLLVPRLNALQIASFRFDFTGHYDSKGDIADVTISQGVDDLKSAIDFLKRYKWVDFSRLGLFGSSYGGNVILWYVAIHNKVKAIVLKSPVSDYAAVRELQLGENGILKWKKKGFTFVEGGGGVVKTKYDFYEDAKLIDTYEIVKTIRIDTLIIHGDKDDNVPVMQSKKLYRVLKNRACLEIVPDANHSYKQPGQLEFVIDLSAKFFGEKLK